MAWAKIIDLDVCNGCHACTDACRAEFGVPLGFDRSVVRVAELGPAPDAVRAFQVLRCVQCADAPCSTICPTGALVQRPDGIVDVAGDACIGCRACLAACPYDALFINPDEGTAEKCNLCAHRLDVGLAPACAVACPTQAIWVGPSNAPETSGDRLHRLRSELGTHPAMAITGGRVELRVGRILAPPPGGIFPDGEQPAPAAPPDPDAIAPGATAASVVLAWDRPHRVAWDLRFSLAAWTRALAAGVYLVPAALVLGGLLPDSSALWRLVAPMLAGLYAVASAGLSLGDLEHPRRLLRLITGFQWQSWLARGFLLFCAFAALLALHLFSALLQVPATAALALPGSLLALALPGHTAFLLRQCRGRTLWHGPTALARMMTQPIAAGAATLLPFANLFAPHSAWAISSAVALGSVGYFLLALWELTHPPADAVGAAAHRVLSGGAFRGFAIAGLVCVFFGVAAPLAGAWISPFVLAGVLLFEYAYVQAGQFHPQT